MKNCFFFIFILLSILSFGQNNIKAYYQYKTSFPKTSLGREGVSVIYELNQKDNEANFSIKKGDRFYNEQFTYLDLENERFEDAQVYKGEWYNVQSKFNEVKWEESSDTKLINGCESKLVTYHEGDFKRLEVWYCPSETKFSPFFRDYQFHQLPGYVVQLKIFFNNKAGQITEYNLLEYKENKSSNIVKPDKGIILTQEEAKQKFKLSFN